jgi:hypothetical protein
LRIAGSGQLRALRSWTEVSPYAIKLTRRCIQTAATRRVQLNAPAGSGEIARVFAGASQHRATGTPSLGRRTFLHDLAPIREDLIDRIRHVDERFVKEGCGMPDSQKQVKSYDWTDEEWLRLMREMDPKEEISAIERRVAEWRDAADNDAV